ncbi:MFS transporter [Paenibacillus validus]|uniref:MFS transporter n=1 Tax=Paenibacillus validus TaxID=44253 RepID=A0A7X2ZD85_9BACL|nr:MFS transporter [Paenibacillus validus]MED4601813.1 MFS transporter [Paenibacillus validus]MED4605763.1 MFS transporter [Paenibacillus validus]MUG72707.1 MFS transporter [Paenibacillus validus]
MRRLAQEAGGLRSRTGMQAALLGCVFLGLFTEVLLSPYYPQFFRQVFGVEDYSYTGFYLFVCRLTVVLCSPVWGWLARKAGAKRLLFAGQAGTALTTALLASADSATEFLILTVCLLLFKSSYMLIYPILMELIDRGGQAGSAAKFHTVHHTAVLLAALTGAHMLQMERPLTLFYGAAAADVVQLLVCIGVLWGWRGGSRQAGEPESAGSKLSLIGLLRDRYIVTLGLLFFTLTVANQVVRPFFTPYVEEAFRLSTGIAGVLFLLPHACALTLLPFLRSICKPGRLHVAYTLGVATMAAGLMIQALSEGITGLIIGRMLYGMFLAITMAVLDVILFERERGTGAAMTFSVMVSFQTAGELLSPLLASFLSIQAGLNTPLLAAALLCLVNTLLFRWSAIHRSPKEAAKWNVHGSKT